MQKEVLELGEESNVSNFHFLSLDLCNWNLRSRLVIIASLVLLRKRSLFWMEAWYSLCLLSTQSHQPSLSFLSISTWLIVQMLYLKFTSLVITKFRMTKGICNSHVSP